MPKKQDTTPQQVLQRVIAALEKSDSRGHPSHRLAIVLLLDEGPLLRRDAILRHMDKDDAPSYYYSTWRAELVAFLRSAVRFRDVAGYGSGISVSGLMQFFVKRETDGSRRVAVKEGSPRDLAILQLLLLLQEVDLHTVQQCAAGDCPRIFVKTYRRLFCSTRCQARTVKRRLRQAARDDQQQLLLQGRARRRRVTSTRKDDRHG